MVTYTRRERIELMPFRDRALDMLFEIAPGEWYGMRTCENPIRLCLNMEKAARWKCHRDWNMWRDRYTSHRGCRRRQPAIDFQSMNEMLTARSYFEHSIFSENWSDVVMMIAMHDRLRSHHRHHTQMHHLQAANWVKSYLFVSFFAFDVIKERLRFFSAFRSFRKKTKQQESRLKISFSIQKRKKYLIN